MPLSNIPGLIPDRTHPIMRGLVGWWPMNEGAGARVNDISPYQNAGLFGNISPGPTSGWSGGPLGRAVQFDGSDDIVTVPHAAQLALTGDMSACAWFRPTSSSNYRSLLIKGNVGAGYPSPFHITVESGTGYLFAMWGNGSGQTGVYTAAALTMGLWYFAVATRLGSTVTLYINGEYNNSANLGGQAVTDAGTPLGIGARPSGTSYPMLGGVANARLYNRALSASEVAQLYADPLAGARAPRWRTRTFIGLLRSLTADRLHNRRFSRIYRRGES